MLTRRENQIARLAHNGKSNKEIARELNIAPLTVQSTMRNIFKKIGVSRRKDVLPKLGISK